MGKKVSVLKFGKEAWLNKYKVGIEKGAEAYRAMIPYMTQSYAEWINFVWDDIVAVASYIPPKIEGGDPAENYRLRGAPFARLFKRLSAEYRAQKLRRELLVAPPVPAPTPAPTVAPRIRVVA